MKSAVRRFHGSAKCFSMELPKYPLNKEKYPIALKTKQFGIDVLHNPLWNKSTAFDYSERDRLGLRGLLPPVVRDLEYQVKRIIEQIREQPNNILKNLILQSVCDRNETLFHRVLVDYIEELAPIVYTPTVGEVCQRFGVQFNRTRGMYFSTQDRGLFQTMVHNWPQDDVQIIVVTDGSRILGLGDLGAHGMGIPIGKLALYCAAGGIAPHRVLPITLDVGTNNDELLNSPNYIGLKHKRIEGAEYLDFLDEFILAVFRRWPGVVLQFEDFATPKAVPLLERYRHIFRVFNDDIQGTGAVTLAGVLSAAKIAGVPISDMRFMCVGAGSAGLGVCEQLVRGLIASGMTEEEAYRRFVICTVEGAIGSALTAKRVTTHVTEMTKRWVNDCVPDGADLVETAKKFKPHVLLGLTAHAGVFSEELVRTVGSQVSRPIIMPMSNPTSRAECTPEQAYLWTEGRAIVATGSPFEPVKLTSDKMLIPSQCNNMFIFPGLGLAASIAGVQSITDSMLYAAATACANAVSDEEIAQGRTFPRLRRIRDVSFAVACAVVKSAVADGIAAGLPAKAFREGIPTYVHRKMYFPSYVPLVDPRRI